MTDDLYHFKAYEFENDWNFHAVQRVIDLFCAQSSCPLVVVEMAMEKAFTFPSNAKHTYYAAPGSVGSNEFTGCDSVLLIGHHQVPYNETVRLANALRWRDTLLRGEQYPDEYNPHEKCATDCPIYGYMLANGSGIARTTIYPADPDAREIALASYSATITQIIGRLRPSDPQHAEKPLPVLMLIGEPPRNINIDAVITLPDWLEKNDPEWISENPAPPGRVGCHNNTGINNFEKHNSLRTENAYQRMEEAVQHLWDEGVVTRSAWPSQNILVSRAKVGKKLAQRFLAEKKNALPAVNKPDAHRVKTTVVISWDRIGIESLSKEELVEECLLFTEDDWRRFDQVLKDSFGFSNPD